MRGRREPEKHRQRSVQLYEFVVAQSAESLAQTGSRDGGDLVDHQAPGPIKPVVLRWLDPDPDEGSINRIGRERTDRQRRGRVEPVVLNDEYGSWLAGVGASRCRRVYLAAPHADGACSSSAAK